MPFFFLSMFGFVKSGLTALLGWLSRRSFAELGCIALGLLCAVQFISIRAAHRHAAKVEAHDRATHDQLDLCRKGRQADRDSYAHAQEEAKAKNIAQVKTVEQQYQRNSDDERQAYLDDLARLHAGGLRNQSPASPRPADHSGSPAAPSPAAGTNADGLHLPDDARMQAAEIELRLMHLQNWVEKQLAIDPNR